MNHIKQYWIYSLMLFIIILSSFAWWFSQDRIPDEIHIAAGMKGGQYYKLMRYLQPYIEQQTNRLVFIHEDLRADRAFSIFLMQCANLIMKIQVKINLLGPMQEGKNHNGE